MCSWCKFAGGEEIDGGVPVDAVAGIAAAIAGAVEVEVGDVLFGAAEEAGEFAAENSGALVREDVLRWDDGQRAVRGEDGMLDAVSIYAEGAAGVDIRGDIDGAEFALIDQIEDVPLAAIVEDEGHLRRCEQRPEESQEEIELLNGGVHLSGPWRP